MTATKTKAALLLIPGSLKMIPAVKDHKQAAALAEKHGYIAWFWDRRVCRLYAKVKESK